MTEPQFRETYGKAPRDAFRDAGLTNGGEPGCSCYVDDRGYIYQSAYCPVVHERAGPEGS
jgi:hypothetical protein